MCVLCDRAVSDRTAHRARDRTPLSVGWTSWESLGIVVLQRGGVTVEIVRRMSPPPTEVDFSSPTPPNANLLTAFTIGSLTIRSIELRGTSHVHFTATARPC